MLRFCSSLVVVLVGTVLGFTGHTWDFELLSFVVDAPPEVLNLSIRLNRISRGEYGVSGEINLYRELGNDIIAEVKSYISPTGNNQFQLYPFRVPPMKYYDFLNLYYSKYLMKSIRNCSNFPQREIFISPIEPGVYHVRGCKMNRKDFPPYIQPGTYKVVATGKGDYLNVEITSLAKVTAII